MANQQLAARSVNLQHLDPKVTARALGGTSFIVSPSAPGSPVVGDLWINSASSNQLAQWNGAMWVPVQINAGMLSGSDFTINSSGMFFYSSPPSFTHWDFESGTQSWAAAGATLAQSPQQANSGAYSAMLTYTSGTAWAASSPQVAVTAGVTVYAAAWVYAPQALGAVGLQLAWYSSGGTLLSTSSATTAALAAGSWTRITFNAAAPASAAFVSVIVQDNETSTTGFELFIDDVYLAGALAISVTPSIGVNTVDPLGNSCPAGVTAFGSATSASLYNIGNVAALLLAFPGAAHSTLISSVFASLVGAGTAAEQQNLFMTSGKSGGDDAALQLFGQPANGSAPATAVLEFGGTVMLTASKNGLVVATSGGLSAPPNIAFTDPVSKSGSSATFFALSDVYTVPAGDAKVGTVYRIKIYGNGTQAGTAGAIGVLIELNGAQLASASAAAAIIPASQGFIWQAEFIVSIRTAGAGGTAEVACNGSICQNVAATASNAAPFLGNNTSQAFNTTVSNSLQVFGAMGAGAGSLASYISTFERLGP